MRLVLVFIAAIVLAGCNSSSPEKKTIEEKKEWTLLPFVKVDEVNPILGPDSAASFNCPIIGPVKWEAKDVFNPAAVVRHDTVFLLYRAEDKVGKYAGTSRIGLAWSTDGLHFTRHPFPVLYPDNDSLKKYEWEGGCEDPRIVEDETGIYYLTYTAYDGKTARLMVASSTDLYHWKKFGPAFSKAYSGRFAGKWSKSGSIVCQYRDGKAIAARINGRYWMYWGDTHIYIASSDDLINWSPEITGGEVDLPVTAVWPMNERFDSDLTEAGPPAMVTDSGILLLYNSRNVHMRGAVKGDSSIPDGTYSAAQVLFSKDVPWKELHRMDTPFLKPDKRYEMTGQVNNVCFIEGLVNYKQKWFLYYGTADSKIAVAVKQ